MAGETTTNGTTPDNPPGLEAMATVFASHVQRLAGVSETQQIAILGLAAALMLSPATAQIDPRRLAVAIEALTANRKDSADVRPKIAAFVALIADMAKRLPEVMAEANAAEAAAKMKGPGGDNVN
jgi:hypothetical protein